MHATKPNLICACSIKVCWVQSIYYIWIAGFLFNILLGIALELLHVCLSTACCNKLAFCAQYPHAIFPACIGNHSTSLSSAIITILLSSELESDTFSKTFQITPLLGFSTKPFRANLCFVLVSLNRLNVTFACKKCPLFSCQSVLVVSAESVAGAGWIRG